jgi:hypothetical protein
MLLTCASIFTGETLNSTSDIQCDSNLIHERVDQDTGTVRIQILLNSIRIRYSIIAQGAEPSNFRLSGARSTTWVSWHTGLYDPRRFPKKPTQEYSAVLTITGWLHQSLPARLFPAEIPPLVENSALVGNPPLDVQDPLTLWRQFGTIKPAWRGWNEEL